MPGRHRIPTAAQPRQVSLMFGWISPVTYPLLKLSHQRPIPEGKGTHSAKQGVRREWKHKPEPSTLQEGCGCTHTLCL